jgi:hypothetical protein
VTAWGNNNYGQTTLPPSLSNVVAVAAGDLHSLALLANGTVVAWGYNAYGQTNTPSGLTNVVAIAAGTQHCLALVGDGPPRTTAPMSNPRLSNSGFSVEIPSQSGRVYGLEYKSTLNEPAWTRLPLAAGNGTNLVLCDPTAGAAQRLYRVRRW